MPSTRSCGTFYSCSTCLASFPHPTSRPSCKWCVSCPTGGKCIKSSELCHVAHPCHCSVKHPCSGGQVQHYQGEHKDSNECVPNKCEATSCPACKGLGNCIWTPQLNWASEVFRGISTTPYFFSWNCFTGQLGQNALARIIIKSPPDPCPQLCTVHTSCNTCLKSKGMFSVNWCNNILPGWLTGEGWEIL